MFRLARATATPRVRSMVWARAYSSATAEAPTQVAPLEEASRSVEEIRNENHTNEESIVSIVKECEITEATKKFLRSDSMKPSPLLQISHDTIVLCALISFSFSLQYALGKHRSNALELVHRIPVIEVEGEMAVCDGGGGAMGHPVEYISLAVPGEVVYCKYCALRYTQKKH